MEPTGPFLLAGRLHRPPTAITIAGQPAAAQQGLLAAVPVVSMTPPATNIQFLFQTTTDPYAAAFEALDFDVNQLLRRAERLESPQLLRQPSSAQFE